MTQSELEREVSEATGESLKTVRRRGFSIVKPHDDNFDPEPNILPFQMMDWDEQERRQQLRVA